MKQLSDFIPKFHDRETELIRQRDTWKQAALKLEAALYQYRNIGANDIQDVGKEPITAEVALEEFNKFKEQK